MVRLSALLHGNFCLCQLWSVDSAWRNRTRESGLNGMHPCFAFFAVGLFPSKGMMADHIGRFSCAPAGPNGKKRVRLGGEVSRIRQGLFESEKIRKGGCVRKQGHRKRAGRNVADVGVMHLCKESGRDACSFLSSLSLLLKLPFCRVCVCGSLCVSSHSLLSH